MILPICYLRNDGVVSDERSSNLGLGSSLIFPLDSLSIHQLYLERRRTHAKRGSLLSSHNGSFPGGSWNWSRGVISMSEFTDVLARLNKGRSWVCGRGWESASCGSSRRPWMGVRYGSDC